MQISRRAVLVRGGTMLTGLYFVGSADAATAGVSYRLIVRLRAVNAPQWRALFGHQRQLRHSHVDHRWASTKRALREAARAEKALKAHPRP